MIDTDAVIITHGDVDGMVCAAQLIRREKSNCFLIFSNAKYVKNSLVQFLRSDRRPHRIYISDIPANLQVVKIIHALKNNGTKVFWIDHHPWGDGVKEQIGFSCEKVIYNASLQTPAGVLMGRWLKDEDPYYDQIGNICYAYEKGTEWERNWFLLLSSYIGNSDKDVLERLAYNRNFTANDLYRIELKQGDEHKAVEILNRKPQIMKTISSKTIAVYDTSKNQGIYLGHKVFDHHNVDYCLIHITEKKWQLACNPSRKYPMNHLMGIQNIEGNMFSVGGRENELLSIEIDRNADNNKTHKQIINWLCNKLK